MQNERKNKVRLVIDTDLGCDSDDALALALACRLHGRGKTQLAAITCATARPAAPAAAAAIAAYYGVRPPIGRLTEKLACDELDYYNRQLADGATVETEESVALMKRILDEGEAVIAAIGPLTAVARLLQERPQAENLRALYIMAGRFDADRAEWNVLQNVEAARYVFTHAPCPIVVSPFEVGAAIQCGATVTRGPVRQALELYATREGWKSADGAPTRCAWDPVTVLAAIDPEGFTFSPFGTVDVDETGVTRFRPGAGKHRILGCDPTSIRDRIDAIIATEQND